MKTNSSEEQVLRPKMIKFIFYQVICLAFLAMGILMIRDGEVMGWFATIFFGLGFLVLLINFIPGASYLKLNKEGFEVCSMFRKHQYKWSEIQSFGVGVISNNKMVMFDFTEEYGKQTNARKVSSFLAGAEGALHDTFGLKAEELAALMNEYKRKSLL